MQRYVVRAKGDRWELVSHDGSPVASATSHDMLLMRALRLAESHAESPGVPSYVAVDDGFTFDVVARYVPKSYRGRANPFDLAKAIPARAPLHS